jgi:hypothetical protein
MHWLKSAILAIFQKSADWLDCPFISAHKKQTELVVTASNKTSRNGL